MAIRQYIGARYMPKFVGLYDATTAYEALSVVDNGMGTSYVANKPVPAGTPLTDPDYWAVYGASSGAILHLQDQIDAINNVTIPEINSDISDANANINKTLYRGNAGKAIIIGDSYNVQSVVNPTWGSILIQMLNFESEQHFGWGAKGFTTSPSFLDELQGVISTITDKDKVKHIIVCGGANDVNQSYNTIYTGISDFRDYCKAQFPNANLCIGFISWSLQATAQWVSTMRYYKQACSELGIRYLNGVDLPMHNLDNLQNSPGNYHHPNADGSKAIANAVAEAFLSGSYVGTAYGDASITAVGKHLIPSQGFDWDLFGDALRVHQKQIVYGNTGGSEAGVATLTANDWTHIGSVDITNYIGLTAGGLTSPNVLISDCILWAGSGLGAYPCQLAILSGNLYLRVFTTISTGFGGYITGFDVVRDVRYNY